MNQSDPDFGQPEIPEKVVTDYSPEELAAFREDFAPSARHFRKRSWQLLPWGGLIVLFTLGLVVSDSAGRGWLLAGILGSCVVVIVLHTRLPSLNCPACEGTVTSGMGAFCPECGARSVVPGHRPNHHHCTSCNRWLLVYKGTRQYKVRACTHCGVMLDDKGLRGKFP